MLTLLTLRWIALAINLRKQQGKLLFNFSLFFLLGQSHLLVFMWYSSPNTCAANDYSRKEHYSQVLLGVFVSETQNLNDEYKFEYKFVTKVEQ